MWSLVLFLDINTYIKNLKQKVFFPESLDQKWDAHCTQQNTVVLFPQADRDEKLGGGFWGGCWFIYWRTSWLRCKLGFVLGDKISDIYFLLSLASQQDQKVTKTSPLFLLHIHGAVNAHVFFTEPSRVRWIWDTACVACIAQRLQSEKRQFEESSCV